MTEETFVESTSEASKGGYQSIKKVRGILTELKQVPSRFTEGNFGKPKDQIEVLLTDAVILELFPGGDEIELKDGQFRFWVPYAEPGKIPNANSIYMRTWVASAEALGKKPSGFKGEYVTLEKKLITLFKTDKGEDKKPLGLNPDGSKIYREVTTDKHFLFVKDSDDVEEYETHIKELVKGKAEKVAHRAVLLDTRTQQHPEYKEAVKAGTLGQLLGLKLVDGIYTEE